MRAAILLAAGSSRRFGRPNKLLAMLHGRPVLLHALDRANAAGVRRIVVVLGADRAQVGRLLAGRGVRTVFAADHADGLAASLAAGLRALRPIDREVLIFLADMPFATAHRTLRLRAGLDAVRPCRVGQPGHPMLVRTAAARQARMAGDTGLARALGRSRVGGVRGGAGNLLDLDTVARLSAARRGSRIRPLR